MECVESGGTRAVRARGPTCRQRSASSRSMAVQDQAAEKTGRFRSKFICQAPILVAPVVGSVGTWPRSRSESGRACIFPLFQIVDRACRWVPDGLTRL